MQHLKKGNVVGRVLGDGCQYAVALPERKAVEHLRRFQVIVFFVHLFLCQHREAGDHVHNLCTR